MLIDECLEKVRTILNGLLPHPPLIPLPAGAGFPAGTGAPEIARPEFFGGAGGGSQQNIELLQSCLEWILNIRKLCEMYLNARMRALEYTYIGNRNTVVREPSELYKYVDDVESLFEATFNTLSEMISRDNVHKRLGLRFSSEEFAEMPMIDKVTKLIRNTVMVYQILCITQSAFKNLQMPAKIESAIS